MAGAVGGDQRRLVTIAVCTFRRNDLLRAVVPMLLAQGDAVDASRYLVEVLVIDNNPGADAAPVVQELQGAQSARPATRLRYVHEPRPGLSAARNAALAHATGEVLAFIDDDEIPSDAWLAGLLATQETYAAAVVVGPILVRYEHAPPEWIAAGRFFERARFATGTPRPAGHTSNLLLDLGFIRSHGLSFREEFGMAGGEDTMLTMEMGRLGGRIVWCDEAPVTDLVPADRMTRQWVLDRRYRMGNSHSRVLLALQPSVPGRTVLRLRLIGSGWARAAVGGALRLVGRATGSMARDARGATLISRGTGMAAGAMGREFLEYRRPAEAPAIAVPSPATTDVV